MDLIESKTTIFVLDTNILLGMGRQSLHSGKAFLKSLESIKDRLWIPRQVYKEFEKNKNQVFGDTKNRYKNVIKALDQKKDNFVNGLNTVLFNPLEQNYIGINQLKQSIFEKVEEISTIIKEYDSLKEQKAEIIEFKKFKNEVSDFVAKLKKGREISLSERMDILSEGELRYKYQIPPGFKDEDKDKKKVNPQGKYGDLFLWKEILELPSEKNFSSLTDIVFITNDQKEDWFEKDKIHPDLLQEFKERWNDKEIHFIKGADFYKKVSQFYGIFEDDVYVKMYILEIIEANSNLKKIKEVIKRNLNKIPTPFDVESFKDFKINNCKVIKYEYKNKKLTVKYLIQLKINTIGYYIDKEMDEFWKINERISEENYSIESNVIADLKMKYNEKKKVFEKPQFKVMNILIPETVN